MIGRGAQIRDVLIDGAGAIAGKALYWTAARLLGKLVAIGNCRRI